jgi:hypothetical protein
LSCAREKALSFFSFLTGKVLAFYNSAVLIVFLFGVFFSARAQGAGGGNQVPFLHLGSNGMEFQK